MEKNISTQEKCFVIMPIGVCDDLHTEEHFRRVYEDIFIPAIKDTGYIPHRADDVKSSSIIQEHILRDIIEAPMAICDLSTRNPNVLFELGVRQAFDLPIVLVEEEGTPRIFDIANINTISYRKERIYDQVLYDRKKISEAILETKENKNVNSIIKLLGISKANVIQDTKNNDSEFMLYSILNAIKTLSRDVENINTFKTTKYNENYEYHQKLMNIITDECNESKQINAEVIINNPEIVCKELTKLNRLREQLLASSVSKNIKMAFGSELMEESNRLLELLDSSKQ